MPSPGTPASLLRLCHNSRASFRFELFQGARLTDDKRQVIRDYALALESHGQKDKGPIKNGAAYTVVRYQVYDAKGRRDLEPVRKVIS